MKPSYTDFDRVKCIASTENQKQSPKTTLKIKFIGELYPPSICFLVVYVYIHIIYDILLQGIYGEATLSWIYRLITYSG